MKDTQLIGDILRVELYKEGTISFPVPMQVRLASMAASCINGNPVCAWDIREDNEQTPTLDSKPTLKMAGGREAYGNRYECQLDCTMNDNLDTVRAQCDTLLDGSDYDIVLTVINQDATSASPVRRVCVRCTPNTFVPQVDDNIAAYNTIAVKIKMKSLTPPILITE